MRTVGKVVVGSDAGFIVEKCGKHSPGDPGQPPQNQGVPSYDVIRRPLCLWIFLPKPWNPSLIVRENLR